MNVLRVVVVASSVTLLVAAAGSATPRGTFSGCVIVQHEDADAQVDLTAVAGVNRTAVYTVGNISSGPRARLHSFVQRWDGHAWTRVRTPDVGPLNGVSATARNNVWALGRREVLHWNGRVWERLRLPNLDTKQRDVEYSAIAATAKSIWAIAGEIYGASFVVQWNGKHWRTWRASGVADVKALDAVSDSDVWVAGLHALGGQDRTVLLHWNGRTWRHVVVGNDKFLVADLDASARHDLWIAGYTPTGTPSPSKNVGVVEHWDGTEWHVLSEMMLSNPYGLGYINYGSISAVDKNTAWLGGFGEEEAGSDDPFVPLTIVVIAADTLMPAPSLERDAIIDTIDAIDGSSAWAVGGRFAAREERPADVTSFVERVDCS